MSRIDNHPDTHVIAELARRGSDLSKPHPLEFYLYFPSESQAKQAEEALKKSQFKILCVEDDTEPSTSNKSWLVLAQKDLVPIPEVVIETSDRLEDIALANGGKYDGWEAPVTT